MSGAVSGSFLSQQSFGSLRIIVSELLVRSVGSPRCGAACCFDAVGGLPFCFRAHADLLASPECTSCGSLLTW